MDRSKAAAVSTARSDARGLICAFWLDTGERCSDDILTKGLGDRPVWLHFNLADVRARNWLQQDSHLPAAVIVALTEPQSRIRSEIIGEDGTLAVLGDLHHDFDLDPEGFGLVRIYVDPRQMISVRHERLRTVDRVRRDLLDGIPMTSTEGLFEHFIARLSETLGEVVTTLADQVDQTEDEILAGRFRSQGSVLGRVRMSIARLRRHIARNRAALASLRAEMTHGPDGERRARLRQAMEQMETAAQDIDLVQERTRLLQDEIAGRLGEATNRDLFLLSTITAAVLPINLVTGVFGMNVGGLPGVEGTHGFRWVMTGMIVAVGAVLALLRWGRRF